MTFTVSLFKVKIDANIFDIEINLCVFMPHANLLKPFCDFEQFELWFWASVSFITFVHV